MTTIYQEELVIKKLIHRKLRGGMTPQDNVLYWRNNIDVRLCPKNGISTLKYAAWYHTGISIEEDRVLAATYGTKRHRVEQIREFGHSPVLPYRKDSRRVAVVRDPIERFMSAAEYLKMKWIENVSVLESSELDDDEKSKVYRGLSDVDLIPDDIDELIEGVASKDITNSHFYTQAYWMGCRSQYTHIFKMSQFGQFMNWLRQETETSKKIDKIRSNHTSGLYYGGVSNLTEQQQKRIMKLYEEDYDYGWTENNATKSF